MATKNESNRVPEITVRSLLKSRTVTIRDTYCQGSCRHKSTEECTATTRWWFRNGGYKGRIFGLAKQERKRTKWCFSNAPKATQSALPVRGAKAGQPSVTVNPRRGNLGPPPSCATVRRSHFS